MLAAIVLYGTSTADSGSLPTVATAAAIAVTNSVTGPLHCLFAMCFVIELVEPVQIGGHIQMFPPCFWSALRNGKSVGKSKHLTLATLSLSEHLEVHKIPGSLAMMRKKFRSTTYVLIGRNETQVRNFRFSSEPEISM